MASVAERLPELAKYELLEEIGHGGMATVYRARDRRLGREVAVKLIHPHLRQNPEVASRFISEARAVAKLRHPNIVEVYDVSDSVESERYLVVELIRGVTLRQLLSEHKRLPVEIAVAITLELCAALEHAHTEGVIHRDIKPENVLVELHPGAAGTARIMLTDFGIAKLLDAQGITSTGQVLGSPAHMAPEQIEGAAVDARADVFGLGVLLYECLVGHLPFDGKNPAQVLRAVLEGTFISPEKERPEVGSRFAVHVARSLSRDVDKRFESVPAFAAALRGELETLQFTSSLDEVARFLKDPAGYEQLVVQRVVPRLIEAGEHARSQRRIAEAAAHFNRALAYSPRDPELLARVSGLERRKLWYAGARWALAAGCVALAAFLVVTQVSAYWASVNPRLVNSEVRPEPAPVPAKREPPAPPPPEEEPPVKQATRLPKLLPRLGVKPVTPGPPRQVIVRITGAMGGSLKIDGQPKEWFGAEHQLDPGEHVFEFIPPDDSCCVPQTRRVLIKEGEGVQQVVGHLAFRDATLASSDASGLDVRCPTLFAGSLRTPGELGIPMARASVSGSCTVTPPGEGSVPVKKVVTLRAGQTTQLSWP